MNLTKKQIGAAHTEPHFRNTIKTVEIKKKALKINEKLSY